MHTKKSQLPRHARPGILAADQPLVVPMLLRISDLKLRGIVVLVVSKTKGITLVFKNDPLENILISSTFDSVSSVRNFLQREIEKQLRTMFQEDLPVMIHNLSLRYINKEQEEKRRQELQRRHALPSPPTSVMSDMKSRTLSSQYDTMSMPELTPQTPSLRTRRLRSEDDLASFSGYLSEGHPAIYRPQHEFASFGDLHYHDSLSLKSAAYANHLNGTSTLNYDDYSRNTSSMRSTDYIGLDPSLYAADQNQDICSEAPSEDGSLVFGPSSTNSVTYEDYSPSEEYGSLALDQFGLTPVTLLLPQDQEIVLQPSENAMAAKLAQLACANHTISPFTPTLEHYTYRSLPHTVKRNGHTIPNKKKIPKRRIIRYSTPQLEKDPPKSPTDSESSVSWERRPSPLPIQSPTSSLSQPLLVRPPAISPYLATRLSRSLSDPHQHVQYHMPSIESVASQGV
jgi:distribution and morphology protein 34